MADTDTTTSTNTTTNLGIELINGSDYISPDPINEGFKILDKLGIDYVVESGTSGEWWYRKWNSGRAECGVDAKTFSTTTSTTWAGTWGLTPDMTFGAYPFAFSQSPVVTINFIKTASGGMGGMIHIRANNSTAALTTSPNFSIADATCPRTYQSPVCSIFVAGKYK